MYSSTKCWRFWGSAIIFLSLWFNLVPVIIQGVILSNSASFIKSNGITVYTQPYFSDLVNQQYILKYIQQHNISIEGNLTLTFENRTSPVTRFNTSVLSLIPPRPSRKLYDVFGYNGELSLLMWRLYQLRGIVSTFIIVEGDHTYQGNPKNSTLTPKVRNKIAETGVDVVFVTAELVPRPENFTKDQRWQLAKENEMRQRDAASLYLLLNGQDDDMILIGDVDELPDPEYLRQWRTFPSSAKMRTKMFYYSFDCAGLNYWYASAISSVHAMKEFMLKLQRDTMIQKMSLTIPVESINLQYPSLTALSQADVPLSMIRLSTRYLFPVHYLAPNARLDVGWHCSFCMSPEDMQNKLKSFTHIEYSDDQYTQLTNIYDAVLNCKDLFGRSYMGFHRRPEDWELPIMSHSIEQSTPESIQKRLKLLNRKEQLSLDLLSSGRIPLPAYVINLDKRIDRWENIQKQWNSVPFVHLQRVSAVEHYFSPQHNHTVNGCGVSHLQTIQLAFEEQTSSNIIFVLEDDAVPHASFNDIFPEIYQWANDHMDEWDIIILGCSRITAAPEHGTRDPAFVRIQPKMDYLVRITLWSSNAAMLYNRRIYAKLMEIKDEIPKYPKESMDSHIDFVLAHREDFVSLVSYPVLVYQAPSFSDILNMKSDYTVLHEQVNTLLHDLLGVIRLNRWSAIKVTSDFRSGDEDPGWEL